MDNKLSSEDRRLLLEIARETITAHVANAPIPQRDVKPPRLQEKNGCFVTIKVNGELRGCIGNFTSDKPLYLLVEDMAKSAATKDPRFYPMRNDDLGNFDLEISVLSPLRKIDS